MIKRTLVALALSGFLLAGCGGGTTEVERNSASPLPEPSPPIVSSEGVETPTTRGPTQTPDPTQTPTVELSPNPPEVPASSATATATGTPEEVPAPLEPGGTGGTTEGAASTPGGSGGSWAPMEVTVTTAAETANLTGTPPDFHAFIAERLAAADADGCQSEFTILAFHSDGFAAGQEFAPGCGGAQNIWGKVGGQWETLMVMQSVAECTDMAANNIPTGLPDIPCLDAAGNVVDW